jgi:rhomboid protease GluP
MDVMDPRRMCPHCRAFITVRDRVCPYCNEALAPKQSGDSSGLFAGFIPHARFNTVIILLINFGLYIATALYSMNSGNEQGFINIDPRTLVAFGAKFTPLLAQGEWWRLVTAGFLHGGILHILMNSWVLFDLGAQVEEFYGASRMLVIYFVGTIVGFYASAWWSPVVSVGASAGICGLIGAMIAFGVHNRTGIGAAIRGMYIRWAVYVLLFGLLTQFTDNAAHIGGLAGGFGVAYLAGTPGAIRSPKERLWRLISWVCILTTAFCFLKMYLWFRLNTR